MTTQVAAEGGDSTFRRRSPGRKASGNIAQTLNELGIELDLEPEMAAQDATDMLAAASLPLLERASRSSKFSRRLSEDRLRKIAAEKAAAAAPPPPAPRLAEQLSAPAPQPRLNQQSVAPSRPSARRGAPPRPYVPIAESVEAEELPAEGGENPFFPPMSAPPATLKGRVQKPSPSLGKLGVTIAAMMPGAERVRIEKRLSNGNLGYIADYSKQDLSSHPDLQSFLAKYVKPQYGAGEYKVTGLDGTGRIYDAGSVHLIDPPSVTEQNSAMQLVQGMLSQQQKNHEEQIKELKETMQAQPNPVTMLRDVTALQKELIPPTPPASNAGESTLAAVITSSAQTSMQMMQMMMQQQQAAQAAAQQQTMLMVQQMQQASQQQMQMFMEMMKQKESSSSAASSPMPPPPPPENPLSGVKEIISMLGEMGVFGGGTPPDDTFKQIVLSNQLGVKDVLALVKEMSPTAREGGGNGIKEAFDNMAVVMNMANQLKQNTEGSPQATIWDAVAALVSNRDFAGSIASAIRVNTEQVQRQTQSVQQTQQTQLLAQQRAMQLAAQQRQMALQQRQGDEREIVATPPAPRRAQVAAPENGAPIRPAENVVPIRPARPQNEAAIDPQVASAAAERLRAQNVKAPQSLPAGFEEKINQIVVAVEAKDDAQIVQETVNMVMFFYGHEEWKPFATGLLSAAQAGDKEKTLEILGGFLGGFVEMGLIKRPVGREVLRCISEHFRTIHAQLSGKSESILPPGIDEVFVVPDPEAIDETGNPLDEEEDGDEDGEDDGEDDGEEGDEEEEGDDAG